MNFTAFYEALLGAKRPSSLGDGTSKGRGSGGRSLKLHPPKSSSTEICWWARPYTALVDLKAWR